MNRHDDDPAPRLRWPLPAVLAWMACWCVYLLALRLGVDTAGAAGLGALLGILLSLRARQTWRRLWVLAGFPASLLLLQAGDWPAVWWLVPVAALLLFYPLRTWRDAPWFPTPEDALDELPAHVPLGPGARVLDAGCGVGHGLEALRQAYPLAHLEGVEWSRPMAWWCARRCPWAQVRRGDLWQSDWSEYNLVYLFQRPESMGPAQAKAAAELKPGSWLVSLEFALDGVNPAARFDTPTGRTVWVYTAETLKNNDQPSKRPDTL